MNRLVGALLCVALLGQAPALAAPPGGEAATAAFMASLGQDRAKLRVFLQAMPKGGDLHNHLGGAIYSEDLLEWAAASGLCIGRQPVRIVGPPCHAPDTVPAAGLTADYPAYSRAIDAFSTRGFEQGTGDPHVSGADRFFATFEDFGAGYIGNVGKALAIAREQAAGDTVQYLELQVGAEPLERALPKDWAAGLAPDDFGGMLARLQPRFPAAIAQARTALDTWTAEADAAQKCGAAGALPACRVAVRFQVAAMRTYAPADVFAQLAFGYALVQAEPRFVGVNILAPEHDPVAIRDYRLHMAMLAWLHARGPQVPLSLHAGELTLGMVPPRDLKFHIHDAVTVAGARRIGHGVDISFEDDAAGLLRRMARDRVAVEINLTSNAVILGVRGHAHPLALYRAAGVPVTLSTDDEGVSRTDMTNEYMRAAIEQELDYRGLKAIARDSLQYAFAPGASLWRDVPGGARQPACAAGWNAASCTALARTSLKAALQITQEQEFERFEQDFVPRLATLLQAGAKRSK